MGEYYFGIAGWSYPDWAGVVYPSTRKGKFDELVYLTDYFDTIELNNTFYRIPESKMVESWARRVTHNPRFRFTAKLWQGFTHEKNPYQENDVTQFKKAMDPLRLAGRLGTLLLQFPISYRYEKENQERLSKLIGHFREFAMVVEFRHRSWVCPEVLTWMEELEVGFCNVDEPVFRQMIKPASIVTGSTAYVRFHGRNYENWFKKGGNRDTRYDYLYSEEELDEWIPKIGEMGQKAKDLYIIGNNHFRGQAPANVLQLKSKTIRGPVKVPESMLSTFPELKRIAISTRSSPEQPSLF